MFQAVNGIVSTEKLGEKYEVVFEVVDRLRGISEVGYGRAISV